MGDNVPFTSHLKGRNIMRKPGRIAVAFQAALVLRENEVVGTMLDAALKPRDTSKAVEVVFMGRKVILVPGAVSIAQLTGAPVLIVLLRRTSDWRHQVLEIFPPIHIDGDTIGSFQRCLAVVEAAIRRHPEQWIMWNSPELIRMELLPKTDSPRVRKWMPQLR
jgi:lauroyl/myristoyl acyltransferase